MRYILPIILMLVITGCSSQEKNETNTTKEIKLEENKTIQIEDLTLKFVNKKLIYPQKKVILLFSNNNKYSKQQEEILSKFNTRFYIITDNEYLQNYFNIKMFPSIIILDKNKTIKFENFTPYEFLKEAL